MDYNVERALRGKVDEHTFNALKQEVDRLKQENRDLRGDIERIESKLRNNYTTSEALINALIESDKFEDTNRLFEIRMQL